MLSCRDTRPKAINADHSMEDQEQYKVLVVVQPNAIIDPDAVMVKLLTAHVFQTAVL